jgi:hypothetical protein
MIPLYISIKSPFFLSKLFIRIAGGGVLLVHDYLYRYLNKHWSYDSAHMAQQKYLWDAWRSVKKEVEKACSPFFLSFAPFFLPMSGNSPSTELASSPVIKVDSSSTTNGSNHDQLSEVKEQTLDELVTSLKAKDTSKGKATKAHPSPFNH